MPNPNNNINNVDATSGYWVTTSSSWNTIGISLYEEPANSDIDYSEDYETYPNVLFDRAYLRAFGQELSKPKKIKEYGIVKFCRENYK
jgi:hypothetical protein